MSKRKRSERMDDMSMQEYRDRQRLDDLNKRAELSRKNNETPIRRPDDSSNPSD